MLIDKSHPIEITEVRECSWRFNLKLYSILPVGVVCAIISPIRSSFLPKCSKTGQSNGFGEIWEI